MIKLGLSPKKEFAILGIVSLLIIALSILAGILLGNFVIIGIGGGFAGVFCIFYLTRYNSMIEKIRVENLFELNYLLGFFRVYIRNGYNVYQALKELVNFANADLKKLLETLVSEIDGDKSVQPFVNFAKNFKEIVVEEMMLSIYQMIDDGEQSNYLNQFELIFDKFSDVMNEEKLRKKDRSLGSLSSAPLIGSCFLIIIITVGIVGVIGEIINGL